jgi:hypothetical protein
VTMAALLFGLVTLGACHRKQAGAFATPFPESNQVDGWTKTGETRTFAAADLWQYVDGDAEKYLKAGVQTTSTADYKYQDKTEAVVDVHTMSSAEGSRNIFESEPAGDATVAAVGDASRLYKQSLIFRKGRYLIRIVAYQESAQLQQALVALGHGIEHRLTI